MHFTTAFISVLAAAASTSSVLAAPLPVDPRFVITHDMVIKPNNIVGHKGNFEVNPHLCVLQRR